GASLTALRLGLVPLPGIVASPRLETTIGGVKIPNPVGLAAGYDKNAVALSPLSRAGFGFLEVGAATPRPQEGNPKPRLFRLTSDGAVINRFGFNNEGIEQIATRLRETKTDIPRGLNLGANKDSADRALDYCKVLAESAQHIDFATINISSPNTEKLRDLQGKAALDDLLGRVCDSNTQNCPIFLKVAPDLTEAEVQDIADLALTHKLAAIITTNTTLDREGLSGPHAQEKGGLSGRPLFEKSTRILAQMHAATDGKIDLIGVGGIASTADAYAKIQAGASAVQIYSAMVFQGMSLIPAIANGIDQALAQDGHTNVAQAVGTQRDLWL
ncbi:MAG: quinone-dependent dihydroorotate dehydrogenase, partial [Planktomarina sp.]